MSAPLVVEAIETEFVPVLVFNNREEDAELVKEFGEPTWNNPVVRYLDTDKKDLIKRADGLWGLSETVPRMVAAMKAAGRDVPRYLQLVADENSVKRETATFAMHCFWEGEARLGNLDGVLNTRAAWLDGLEVVEVEFDPAAIDYQTLIETAQSMECASKVFAHSDKQFEIANNLVKDRVVKLEPGQKTTEAKKSDQLYYLKNSGLSDLSMTPAQQVKVNARLGNLEEPWCWLSERQLDIARGMLQEAAARKKSGQ